MRVFIICLSIFLCFSCHLSRFGKITYGNGYKRISVKNLQIKKEDSVYVYAGFLHKRISGNPKKDYTVLGCCYDSLYNVVMKNTSFIFGSKKISIATSKNLRRDEQLEQLIEKIRKRKPYSIPNDFIDKTHNVLIFYINYWEDSYISGGGAAPGGINEGFEKEDIVIDADLILIDNSRKVFYKNSYVSAKKKYFERNQQYIWGRLINNLLE